MTELKQLVAQLYTCLLRADQEGLQRLVTEDFIDHSGRPGMPSGMFSLIGLVLEDDAIAPSMGLTIEDMIEEGDRVAVRWSLHSMRLETRPRGPVANWIQAKGITIYRFVDGRVAERWAALSL